MVTNNDYQQSIPPPAQGPKKIEWGGVALLAGGILLQHILSPSPEPSIATKGKPTQTPSNSPEATVVPQLQAVDFSALDPIERIQLIANQQTTMNQTQENSSNPWVTGGLTGVGVFAGYKWLEDRHPEVLQGLFEQLSAATNAPPTQVVASPPPFQPFGTTSEPPKLAWNPPVDASGSGSHPTLL